MMREHGAEERRSEGEERELGDDVTDGAVAPQWLVATAV